MVRGYNCRKVFEEQVNMLPKDLKRRIKYFRIYLKTNRIHLYPIYSKTDRDGERYDVKLFLTEIKRTLYWLFYFTLSTVLFHLFCNSCRLSCYTVITLGSLEHSYFFERFSWMHFFKIVKSLTRWHFSSLCKLLREYYAELLLNTVREESSDVST